MPPSAGTHGGSSGAGGTAAADVRALGPGHGGAGGAETDRHVGGAGKSSIGVRIESGLYRFKVDGIHACQEPGTGKRATDVLGQWAQIGIAVNIEAKINEFSVSPRDLTLENAGVVLRAEFPSPAPLPGCSPALPVKLSKQGQVVRGMAVFKVPPGFAPDSGTVAVVYRPTRWGGVDPVEVRVPSCLAACPASQAGRVPTPRRRD